MTRVYENARNLGELKRHRGAMSSLQWPAVLEEEWPQEAQRTQNEATAFCGPGGIRVLGRELARMAGDGGGQDGGSV